MKEEKRGLKHHWKRIIKKKGFFPALYLVTAALLLTGVLWYQNTNRFTIPEIDPNLNYQDEVRGERPLDDESTEHVTTPVENVALPTMSETSTKVVTKFYEHGSSQEDQEQALVFYNNNFYQSQGIDIAATTDAPLPVVAALSGTVVEVREDPLLGYVVQLKHDQNVTTYYSSLQDVVISTGDEIEQGDVIAHAGTNPYNLSKGTHVHFQLRKDDKPVNPERFIDQPVTKVTADATKVSENPDEDDERDPDTETDADSDRDSDEDREQGPQLET